jgi:curved DNA-binding protein CbpA
MQRPEQSCFNIMGFARLPTLADLNKAYRKFVLFLHPDKNGGKPHATEAEILFKWVNEANELTSLLIERRR